jgi:signal transduction histidine kinase
MTQGGHEEGDHRIDMPRDRTLHGAASASVRAGRRSRPSPAGPPQPAEPPPIEARAFLPGTLGDDGFLGVLSHELRTPVTTIYGGAQLLASRDLPEARRRALASDVGQEAERLYWIVEDIMVLARSERGELRSADEPVAVGRLIASAVERELARNPGLQIRYLGASDAAAEQADELLITHAVRNLLDNAIRNARGRGPVEVVVDTEPEEVVVRVLDRGSAPTGQEMPGRIDPSGTRAGRAGGGLGLFVAARLVQAMRGRSWARARRGGGAEFGFALRRSIASASGARL